MRISNYLYLLLLLSVIPLSCKKSDFLNTKPDDSLVLPTTLQACQALLDNDWVMNGFGNSGFPCLPEISCDDYYVSKDQTGRYSDMDRLAMIWARQIYTNGEVNDWDLPYRTVFTANNVLIALSQISHAGNDLSTWNSIRGSALFFRAYAFFSLAQVFAPAYDSSTAQTDWGIPLRLSADINEKISRATVQKTYDQIFSDLMSAAQLLPANPDWYPTRPSKAAVYALLSRAYLSTRNYPLALRYADSCLQLKHALMNYDTVSTTLLLPFNRWNPEVIFSAAYFSSGPAAIGKSHVDSTLFRSYQPNDLRKILFFKRGDLYYGTYDQDGFCYAGLAVDEVYLTKSECEARAGNISAAISDLNTLLQTRWAAGTFTPYTAIDVNDALQQVLLERRKQLIFRGIRWTDLRRLNKDTRTARTLTRVVDGILYTLTPDDARWVFAIPDNVISFNPGMPQNNR